MSVAVIRPTPYETDLRRFVNFWDDFVVGNIEPGEIGDAGWTHEDIDGNNGSILKTLPVPGTGNTYGILGVRAGKGVGAGAFAISSGGEYFTSSHFPVGAELVVRLYSALTTAQTFWVGFSSASNPVNTTDGTQFIGIRHEAGVDGNVYGVVKDGTLAASNEDSVAIAAADTTNWVTYTMKRTATSAFEFSANNRASVVSLTTTNLPSAATTLSLHIGMQATGGADRDIEVDFIGVSYPLDRG